MWNPTRRMLKTPAAATAMAAILFGSFAVAPAWADDGAQAAVQPSETEIAVWTPKEVEFTYMGFTTHYSCDGLRDAVKEMLLQLGARKSDLTVYELPCSGNPDRPNPFPGVKIKMSVLTPLPGNATPGPEAVWAQWKPVKLPYRATGIDAAGQCELLEQFKQKVLPLFTTRNVDLHASCVPHELSPVGTKLQAEVLITDQKKPVNRAASAAEAR
jgi:hypothetical protein